MRGEDPSDPADWIRGVLDRFEGPLLLYVGRLLRDPVRAQDVVQEVFLALCREDRDALAPRLAPWLYAVARNRALNEARRERRTVNAEPDGLAAQRSDPAAARSDPALAASERDAARRAWLALDALPDAQQEAVRLKFQHALSYKEIAAVLNLTVTNVGFILHTALKAVRSRLEDDNEARAHA